MKHIISAGLGIAILIIIAGSIALARTFAAVPAPELRISPAVQPPSSLALPGALHVPFTRVELAAIGGDITVRSFVVQQTGKADDGVFESIVLLSENGEPLGDDETLKEGAARFSDVLVIPKGTSRIITVAGNMAEDLSEFEGQQPALSVVEVEGEEVVPVRI